MMSARFLVEMLVIHPPSSRCAPAPPRRPLLLVQEAVRKGYAGIRFLQFFKSLFPFEPPIERRAVESRNPDHVAILRGKPDASEACLYQRREIIQEHDTTVRHRLDAVQNEERLSVERAQRQAVGIFAADELAIVLGQAFERAWAQRAEMASGMRPKAKSSKAKSGMACNICRMETAGSSGGRQITSAPRAASVRTVAAL